MSRTANLRRSLTTSQFGRVLFIGLIILLLEIPAAMVRDVIRERARYLESAATEISTLWGGSQTFYGPTIVARYRCAVPAYPGGKASQYVERSVEFLPDELLIEGRTATELLHRGIYEFPVYRSHLAVRGRASAPDLAALGIDPERAELVDMSLVLHLPDRRSLQQLSPLTWQDESFDFEPGLASDGSAGGLRVPLALLDSGEQAEFAFDVDLNGSKSLYFMPLGGTTEVHLTSDWPEPSFAGMWLPTEREVGAEGFTATWRVPHLAREIPAAWFMDQPPDAQFQTSAFGVELIKSVNAYRMAERSVKYSTLFVLLTFTALWLVDVLTKVAIHPLQYLLVGAAMTVFYLLELSLAEHIGFGAAYALAVAMIVSTIVLYCIPVLRGLGRSAIISLLLATLYGYLYIVLMNQDHALLAGTALLFAALATVMFLTRNIDWFEMTAKRPATAPE